jgi:hypothetical protein
MRGDMPAHERGLAKYIVVEHHHQVAAGFLDTCVLRRSNSTMRPVEHAQRHLGLETADKVNRTVG